MVTITKRITECDNYENFDFGDFGTLKTLNYVKVSLSPEGSVTPSLRVRYDYESTERPQPEEYTLSNIPLPSLFGTAVFNTATFGGTNDPMVRQAVQGSGFTSSYRIRTDDTSAPYSVNGFYIDYTPTNRR